MIVAQEKRKTNITEYILYLWQVEDMIRALAFDMDKIETHLVNQYPVDDKQKSEIREWYLNLVVMMQKEQVQQTGHLQFVVNLVNELNQFHLALLQTTIDPGYCRMYEEIRSDIEMVRQKSINTHNDMEVLLNSLYLILMLKMAQKDISEGTRQAVWKFGGFMGYLSKLFKLYESGDLELTVN